jgi:Tol biopolymer transport system component
VDSARPIGVVPFQWAGQGAAPEDVGGIVAADLRNSGKFNPLDRSRLPQQPGSAQEVQPAAWSALGIDAVVVGQVTQTRMVLITWRISWWIPAVRRVPLAQNSLKSLSSTCAMRRTLPATRYLRS